MNLNSILKSLFGDKSSRDMKAIQPLVEKAKTFTPQVQALSNDELRARTKAIQQQVQQSATEQKEKIDPSTSARRSSTRLTSSRKRPSTSMRKPSTR